MPFHIVKIEPGREPEIVCSCHTGEPYVFESGDYAAAYARDIAEISGIKHQPRPIKLNGDWRAREQARLDNGTYRPLPWVNEVWFKHENTKDHFAHVSVKDAGKISYTENEDKGALDLQAPPMKPGRYLQAFYRDVLSPNEITEQSRVFAAYTGTELTDADTVLFARTADEIEHVYLNGPESCMSHDPSDYQSPFHPVRVYAGPDLAVAYCKDEDGEIIARALCWPSEKIYGRIYPDPDECDNGDKIKELLRREGFKYGQLTGAKFARETDGYNLICPYIDRVGRVTDCGTHLEIGDTRNGAVYLADSTDGILEIDERSTCECCNERYDEDCSAHIQDTGETWCSDCADYRAHFHEPTGEYYRYAGNMPEEPEDEDEEEDEPTPSPRVEHRNQNELPLPIPGALYRVRIYCPRDYPHGDAFVSLDQRSRETGTYEEAIASLSNLRRIYPRVTYTLEIAADEEQRAA